MVKYVLKVKNRVGKKIKYKYRNQDISKFVDSVNILTIPESDSTYYFGEPCSRILANSIIKSHIILIKLNLDIDLTEMAEINYNGIIFSFSKLNVKKLEEYGTYLFSNKPLDSSLNNHLSTWNITL